MKRIILIAAAAVFCSCSSYRSESPHTEENAAETAYIQEFEQLHIDSPEEGYAPLNYQYQVGKWFPYMQYEEYMYGKTADEFRKNVAELYAEAAENGVNTLYLHVHPCGDAYYDSQLFPRGTFLDGSYDPLEIMLEEAHKLELSVHAWINPLRCQTTEQMNALPDDLITKQWADDSGCGIIRAVGERWYLSPAHSEARELVNDCVRELLEKYDLDGIHIDDYFYPTTDKSFDAREFAESGSDDLTAWRLENCTSLVKGIYSTVKNYDERVLFGISPQGNIGANYDSQYADVKLWSTSADCCDYIVPQIYFGFRNAACPFEKTLREWETLRDNAKVKLIIGLAEYKVGKSDKWAGVSGENEWIEDSSIIEKQVTLVKASTADGYAFYS